MKTIGETWQRLLRIYSLKLCTLSQIKKLRFHIARYPVLWDCSCRRHIDFSGKHSAKLQLMRTDYSFTYPPLRVDRYSFTAELTVATWGKRKCQSFETAAGRFEPGFSRMTVRRYNCYATAPQVTRYMTIKVIFFDDLNRHQRNLTRDGVNKFRGSFKPVHFYIRLPLRLPRHHSCPSLFLVHAFVVDQVAGGECTRFGHREATYI